MFTEFEKQKILIVDDSPDNIKVIHEILSNKYQTFFATSGKQALELVSCNKPDLILLDIIMPEMDGFQTCNHLKFSADTQDIPVIFMTGLSDTPSKVKGFQAGAVDYITKPYQAEELLARIKTHLDLKKMQQHLEELVLERTAKLTRKTVQLREEITARQEVCEALQKSEQRYREIYNATSEAVLLFDAETITLLDVNQTMLNMTGYSHGEIMKLQVESLSCENSLFSVDNLMTRLSQTCEDSTQVFDWLIRSKSGDEIWVEISLKRSFIVGQSILVLVARNITERKQAQKEREQLEEQLLKAQKMEAVGTLAGGIAHDFNNILTPLIGFAEMVLQNIPKDNPDHERQLAVLRAGDRATELIRQILTISRQTQIKLQSLKIQPIIKEVLKFIRSSIPSTIEIKTKIDAECEEILADSTLIHQVVMNLCINAYHAMEEDGGTLEVGLFNVTLKKEDLPAKSQLEPGAYLMLEVSDTGHGISPDVLERIFDPYYTTKTINRGTGLGLSVVHGIVQSLKGYISVNSTQGAGTTFSLFLPSSVRNGVMQTASLSLEELRGTESVLVVDDEELIVIVISEILKEFGYQVTTSTDSDAALELFKGKQGEFDLVLMDMNMQKVSGLEFAQEILKIRQDLPIIICTVFSDIHNEDRAKAMGVRGFLMKPITRRDLLLTVRNTLGHTVE